ncbi:coiled-coil domain-containing protein [Dysgonomonas capnocytophagoides]|uniref:hypothetical protein n=1 Tax=Dysgonomonas capnocytophagoides TaxID=45254 RepID=UPI000414B676|nr:hypothetical protein [Dysgonomonas capnocytophagoides]
MANNNSERIDDLVAPEALKQLTDLDDALEKSYQSMEKLLKPTQDVEKALSKAAMTYKDLIDTIAKYESISRRVTTNQTQANQTQRQIIQLQERITNAYSQESLELERMRQVMLQITRTRRNLIQAEQSQSGSLVQLRANLNLLIQSYDAMNEKTRNSPLGQSMLQDIQELNNQLLQLEATTGRNQRNIGNYASGWNGLNVSIQQIAREIPAMAVSMNTFFIAISNNIPMLVDEINRLRAVNLQLAADGQQTISIGRQILKSIFSWNMLITVAVTLLTLFGGKLVKWVGELFKSNEAIQQNIQSLSELRSAYYKGIQDAQKEIVSMKLLYKATQDTTLSIQDRKKAVDQLQKQYPAYFGKLKDETILAGQASGAYINLANAIIAYAKAQAYEDKVVDYQKQIVNLEERREQITQQRTKAVYELNEAEAKAAKAANVRSGSPTPGVGSMNANRNVDIARQNLAIVDSTIEAINQRIDQLGQKSEDMSSKINFGDLLNDPSNPLPKADNSASKQLDDELKAIQDLQELRIKVVTDANKRLSDDDKMSYEQRLGYLNDYISSAKEGIDEQAKNQISNLKKSEMTEKAYTASVTLINEKASEERIKIDQESAKIRESIQKDYAERIIKDTQDRITNVSQIIERAENAEMQNLASAYKRGELTTKQYEDKRIETTRRAAMDRMDAEISSLEELLNRTGITEDQKLQISKQLADARLDFEKYVNEAIISDEEKAAEKRLQIEQQLSDKRKELLQASMELISALFSAQTESQLAALDKQSEANDDYFSEQEDKIERLADAGAISDEQAEARKEALAQQQKERELALEQQKKEINQRQAKFEKAQAIAKIAIDTAVAIMAAWKNPFSAPALIPTIIASGAIQIATVLATPIPEYAKGTDDHKGGLAVVGDGGRSELVITPDNKMYKTPSRSTLVDLPAGSQVMPDFNKAILAMSMQQLITPILDNKTIVIAENERQIELAAQNNKLLSNMGGQIVRAIRNTNRNNSLIRY